VAHTPVFLVRQDNSVTTFLTNPHGTPGLHILWWCPKEQLFIEPAHAGAFDVQGRIIGGPASRGLDRLRTRVKGDAILIDTRSVIRGPTARYDDRGREPGNYDAPGVYSGMGPWNSGPQSFCYQPVIGGRLPEK
jgi:hypothetical protein